MRGSARVCVLVPAEPGVVSRAGSGSGGRWRCGGPPQKAGAGAKEKLGRGGRGKQLSFFSAASGQSELRSSNLESHVRNSSLSSGSESLMANSDGG